MPYLAHETVFALLCAAIPALIAGHWLDDERLPINLRIATFSSAMALSMSIVLAYLGVRLTVGPGGMRAEDLILLLVFGLALISILLLAALVFLVRFIRALSRGETVQPNVKD